MMKGQGRTLLVYCWSFVACDRKGQAFLMTADGVAGTSHRPNVINLNINQFNAATVLYYKDEDTRSARGAAASDEDGNGRRMRENSINIPVLGPIPGQSPLLLGAELFEYAPKERNYQIMTASRPRAVLDLRAATPTNLTNNR